MLPVACCLLPGCSDDNGSLDYYELDTCIHRTFSAQMRELIFPGGELSLRAKFEAIDLNRDGTISFGEFYEQCAVCAVLCCAVLCCARLPWAAQWIGACE